MPRTKKQLTLGSSVGLLQSLEVEAEGSALPTRVNIFTVSPVVLRDGRGPFTYDPQKLIDAFNSNGRDLAINYDHQGIDAMSKAGPVPAAGWISALDYDPLTGMWASIKYWTPTAAAALKAREYRDFSPEFFVRGTEIVAVSGGALTNDPAIFDLVPVITSAEKPDCEDGSYTSNNSSNSSETEMLEKLIAALGLAADATEDAVMAALESLKTSAAVAAAVAAEVGADATADAAAIVTASRASFVPSADVALITARAEKAEAGLVAASARADSAETSLNEMKAAAHAEKVAASVDAAVTAGKITPAQKAWASSYAAADLAGFEAFVSATAVNAVLAASTTQGQPPEGEIVLTAEQKKRAKMAGLTDEQFAAGIAAQK